MKALSCKAFFLGIVITFGATYLTPSYGETPVSDGYQAAYLYIGKSANDDDHGIDFDNLQGIANGDPAIDTYWYFSRYTDDKTKTILYRVSYEYHLKNNFPLDGNYITDLDDGLFCNHIGDIDYYAYNGSGYIVAGYDGCSDSIPRIAIFKASQINGSGELLRPVSILTLCYWPQNGQVREAPWVAVYNNGNIYSGIGKDDVDPEGMRKIFAYDIDWDDVQAGIKYPGYTFQTYELRYEDGSYFAERHQQGGDFSSDGRLFYLATGYHDNPPLCDEDTLDRIHVFRVDQGTIEPIRIRQSSGSAPFALPTGCEDEPEGISYFDMNPYDEGIYHIGMPRSELHVIVLNNDSFSSDNVWIRHYTSIIDIPVGAKISDVYYNQWEEGVWDGAIFRIEAGSYDEQITLQGRNVKMVTLGGAVSIGSP